MLRKKVLLSAIAIIIVILIIVNLRYFNTIYQVALSYLSPPDIEYIQTNQWQYESGYKIGEGDFLEFDIDTVFVLQSDTIVYKSVPKATIVRLDKYLNEIEIRSLNTKQSGIYVNSEEYTK